ncbi:hypothetical protein ACTFIW_008717 [Dictyostelium discoideum]
MTLQYKKNTDDFKFEVEDLVLIVSIKSELNHSTWVQDHKVTELVISVKPFIKNDRRIFKSSDSKYKPLKEEIKKLVDKRNRIIGRCSRVEYRVIYKAQYQESVNSSGNNAMENNNNSKSIYKGYQQPFSEEQEVNLPVGDICSTTNFCQEIVNGYKFHLLPISITNGTKSDCITKDVQAFLHEEEYISVLLIYDDTKRIIGEKSGGFLNTVVQIS